MLARLSRERQCGVHPGQGCFRIVAVGFKLGEQTLVERHVALVSLTSVCRPSSCAEMLVEPTRKLLEAIAELGGAPAATHAPRPASTISLEAYWCGAGRGTK
jgi:hypothetical protein